jgi:hypothetical protein
VTCDEALGSAAVALLTGQEVDADADSHVGQCDSCRAELARLAPLPGVLARLDRADLQLLEPEPAGPALLDRLLGAAARDRRRRRRRTVVLAVAAAVVALVMVPAAVWAVDRLHTTAPVVAGARPAQISWSATDPSTGVSGKAQAWTSAWGSDLEVSISGVPSGTQCTIVVITKDGTSQTAASWRASYHGTAQVSGNVAAPVSSIAHIEIVDDTGHVLLHL